MLSATTIPSQRIRHAVPFFGNHNNVSCGQCVYKMALSAFLPDEDWSFPKMDALCGAIPGKYTWPYKPVAELIRMGFDIVFYTKFDTAAFVKNPKDYLTKEYGAEGCHDNISNSDMPSVLDQAAQYLKLLEDQKFRENNSYYTAQDLRDVIDDGYLTVLWVNSAKLNGKSGYNGHFILVHDYDGSDFIAHDPGGNDPTGRPENQFPDRRIEENTLIAAGSPRVTGQTSDLIAIRHTREKHAQTH